MHHPVASWCVVVGGGEGVAPIVHEGHVRAGGWLLVVGAEDVSRDVVPKVVSSLKPAGEQLVDFGKVLKGAKARINSGGFS